MDPIVTLVLSTESSRQLEALKRGTAATTNEVIAKALQRYYNEQVSTDWTAARQPIK